MFGKSRQPLFLQESLVLGLRNEPERHPYLSFTGFSITPRKSRDATPAIQISIFGEPFTRNAHPIFIGHSRRVALSAKSPAKGS
jgi:hypothetical protein